MNPYYNMRPWARFLIDNNLKFILYILYFIVQVPLSFLALIIVEFPKRMFEEFIEYVEELVKGINDIKRTTKPVKEKE